MQYDANHANEKSQKLLDLIDSLGGKRATDEQLEEASRLCEESNRFIAEWAQTEDGAGALVSFAEKNEEAVEGLYNRIQFEGPKAILTENQGFLEMVANLCLDHIPDLDGDLLLRGVRKWQEFFLSHDHMERLLKLAFAAA